MGNSGNGGCGCNFRCQEKEAAGTRCGASVIEVNIVLMNRDKSTETMIKALKSLGLPEL